MVKEIKVFESVAGCTAKDFFNIVYNSEEACERWHILMGNESVEVSPWDEGVRAVMFNFPLNIPEIVKKVVWVDSVQVRETQKVAWQNDTKFTVTSDTDVLNAPGSNRFTTTLELSCSEDPEAQRCDIEFVVRCSAALLWPMQSTVENIMADRALASMQQFLSFSQMIIQESHHGAMRPGVESIPPSQHRRVLSFTQYEDGDMLSGTGTGVSLAQEVYLDAYDTFQSFNRRRSHEGPQNFEVLQDSSLRTPLLSRSSPTPPGPSATDHHYQSRELSARVHELHIRISKLEAQLLQLRTPHSYPRLLVVGVSCLTATIMCLLWFYLLPGLSHKGG